MKKGRMGMMIRVTTSSTICWNSSSRRMMVPAWVQVAARPMSTENTRAEITGMMGEISSWNSSSGAVRSPSAEDWMDMPGMRTKPAPADSRAAHTDEV